MHLNPSPGTLISPVDTSCGLSLLKVWQQLACLQRSLLYNAFSILSIHVYAICSKFKLDLQNRHSLLLVEIHKDTYLTKLV